MRKAVSPLVSLLFAAVLVVGFSPSVSAQDDDSILSRPSPPQARATQGPDEPSVTVPAETVLRLLLNTQVSTKVNQVDDPVTAVLEESFRIEGKTVFGKGTEFRGRIVEITPAKVGQRQASLKVVFDEVVTDYGTQQISTVVTSVEDYFSETRYKADKDGKLQGGHSGGRTVDNVLRGGALGGIAGSVILLGGGGGGAAAGTLGGGAGAGVLLTKGNDVRLHQDAVVRIKFTKPSKFQL